MIISAVPLHVFATRWPPWITRGAVSV